MNSITQDMKYRQSLLTYALKYGVSRASRKYNKSRSYIYFWLARYDGSLHSLACQSRRLIATPSNTPERTQTYLGYAPKGNRSIIPRYRKSWFPALTPLRTTTSFLLTKGADHPSQSPCSAPRAVTAQ